MEGTRTTTAMKVSTCLFDSDSLLSSHADSDCVEKLKIFTCLLQKDVYIIIIYYLFIGLDLEGCYPPPL